MEPLLASDPESQEYHQLRRPDGENLALSSAEYSTLNHGGSGEGIPNAQTSSASEVSS